ncbi:uncharacterized protein LOC122874668 [Scomber scombrus]|uniref:Uncharacterized protein LOC122874668 n=1 Tax=Scomber scombrus TaxID=13677 RepID=A0AAV1N650_SCOSC
MDREVALQALGKFCNASVTSFQKQGSRGASQQPLLIKGFIATVLDADETSQVSRSNFAHMQCTLQAGYKPGGSSYVQQSDVVDKPTGLNHIIDEAEFFDPQFDCDYTSLRDTETYHRGGEVYERPCGWYRFALKVLDKYDGNAWLGTRFRSTQSVPGEWPVSYHGTSKKGAGGIVEEYYKPGPRQRYGRGIYSTPYISEATRYAKTFTFNKTGKRYKAILQNRINPEYRQKHNNDNYWLVPIPEGISAVEEHKMVERAIRPYGLLIKEI